MNSGTVQGLGVELAYEERGSGPVVILVHGTALTRLVWRETVDALGKDVRAISYDRRGYGDSGAPEDYAGTTVEEQAEDAAALIEGLAVAPAVVCGHSFGGVLTLDLLLRHPGFVRAAVLIEPPLLSLSPTGTDALGVLLERMEAAARDGGREAAVEAFLELQGQDVLSALGVERADVIRASAGAALVDLGAINAWELSLRRLREIAAPVTVVRGTHSPPIYGEVAGALAAAIPSADLRDVDAAHIAPLDAPRELAAVIRELL